MSQEAVVWMVRLLFAALAVVVLFVFVVRPLWRMILSKPDVDLLTPDYASMLEGEELEVPVAPEDRERPERHQVIDMARSDPRATAQLLQRWLKERK